MNEQDFNEWIYKDRQNIAKEYLQYDYLKQEYLDVFQLAGAALDRLPITGTITLPKDVFAIQAIGYLIEEMPEDDQRTWLILKRFTAARKRLADSSWLQGG